MPRKSRELRFQQATSLLEVYKTMNMAGNYQGRFIRDMCYRLEIGKGLSKKQRDWLDSLIEDGAPTPKGDPALIAKIQDAMEADGMQHRQNILSDFLHRIQQGWNLSEKQEKFLNIMFAEAEKVRTMGRWSPDDALCSKLKMAVLITHGRNGGGWYLGHRPARLRHLIALKNGSGGRDKKKRMISSAAPAVLLRRYVNPLLMSGHVISY